MSDYVIINGELYHHGVKGMRWGVRRSRNKLTGTVTKLGNRNKQLSKDIDSYKKAAKDYDSKSAEVISKNSKYDARLAKATAKKAKYDVKLQRQLSKRRPNSDKVAKYTAKSAKYQNKINRAQRKIKYNKWAVKATETRAMAEKAKRQIEKNENVIKVYNSTVKALDAGKIEQGRIFMQYVTK